MAITANADYRTDDQKRLNTTILARLSDRDRKWLRELIKSEAGVKLLLGRI